ncbi:DEAD/DEAH box helicase family protein [Neobacillus sp. NPDC097160]|uniref:DEAD/DEAH box helicase family protein n=1 Tax=Neobacillus sp. NPDC097160 TaxID=3364298 RepID=UPI00380C4758
MSYSTIIIEEEQKKRDGRIKSLFPHQKDAYKSLSETFTFPSEQYKGGLVVIPTGGGKTFTAVNWICSNILSKGIKVLWLAQSSNLLDQAYETFIHSAADIHERKQVNIRVVSSSQSHSEPSSINTTDDVLIITTQSAIKQYNSSVLDLQGNVVETAFKNYLLANRGEEFFVVLDEAHHAPAYGCRNLLLNMKDMLGKYYLLGLTATPTYTDIRRRGWLFEIFDQGILSQANQAELIAQNILALPNYIEKPTGREYEVDDRLYNRLVREHKDLPEDIVERIAKDSLRNNYIINEYVQNKNTYGKTIIFVDRWYQCVYMETKLSELGVNVGSVFSKIDANSGSADLRNQRTKSDNERIIKEFKEGKIDVLLNVRMLAEGADIPDAKTVFVTRQTTSSILLTQMIGRVLRGKRAGGGENKTEANVVLFIDNWKQVIDWARPGIGEKGPTSPTVRGYYPLEYISIDLVEKLSRQIEIGDFSGVAPFIKTIPIGWYITNITVNVSGNSEEETKSINEYVMVYEDNAEAFINLINFLLEENSLHEDIWGNEDFDEKYLNEKWFKDDVDVLIKRLEKQFFIEENKSVGNILNRDIGCIVRHIVQNKAVLGDISARPDYYSFDVRHEYDLTTLVLYVLKKDYNDLAQLQYLKNEFSKAGSLWKQFYKTFGNFKIAFEIEKLRILEGEITELPVVTPPNVIRREKELSETEKEHVKRRDGFQCVCCGYDIKRSLEIDHIIPFSMGGETSIQNSQTLCKTCNGIKSNNAINFKDSYKSLLVSPKKFVLYPPRRNDRPINTLKRIINFYYHCNAVSNINLHTRKNGANYSVWEVELYPENSVAWLEQHKEDLLSYIQNDLGYKHVVEVEIK